MRVTWIGPDRHDLGPFRARKGRQYTFADELAEEYIKREWAEPVKKAKALTKKEAENA
jgi:hypothetical protein